MVDLFRGLKIEGGKWGTAEDVHKQALLCLRTLRLVIASL